MSNSLSSGFIVVLGSPNTSEGKLLPMAFSRLEKAIEETKEHPSFQIVLTGGFNASNVTDKPHAYYAKQYLLSRSIPERRILEFVESRNTLEDGTLLIPLIKKYQPPKLIIVSSDFHMERVEFIFRHLFPSSPALQFSSAPTPLSKEECEHLRMQERKKMDWHLKHGLGIAL